MISGADYVARILNRKRPAELLIQKPANFEFVINPKTAKTFRLKLPEDLL